VDHFIRLFVTGNPDWIVPATPIRHIRCR
jgi:hypothetical protein